MKKIKTSKKTLLILFTCFIFSSVLTAQSKMENFFKYEGAKMLSQMAHPLTDYEKLNYVVEGNAIFVQMKTGYFETILKIYWDGTIFYKIEVGENDIVSAFSVLEYMKDMLVDLIEDDSTNENYIKDRFKARYGNSKLKGSELACMILTFAWYAY
ncbi:hypothetical protein H2O64_09875 [Kordia sp. YSTF-M3]|uniref:Uncharacterized protein n=1 Tax=Kordia aestuariivivens TaxID=2759037 RepID=A0ABR7Q8T9_9FLAO|nr:hypothetical protein [Kordia aestuariivivens]MBC8754979.1 hypothetical protein [Kordia aestuariivivens]